MENAEENISISSIYNNQQTKQDKAPMNDRQLMDYYLEQVRQMCPNITGDQPEYGRLQILHTKVKRMVKLLTILNHPWNEGAAELQKACGLYLMNMDEPEVERYRVVKLLADRSELINQMMPLSNFVANMQRYYTIQLHDLNRLLNYPPDDEEIKE